jgi:hypothetical protein
MLTLESFLKSPQTPQTRNKLTEVEKKNQGVNLVIPQVRISGLTHNVEKQECFLLKRKECKNPMLLFERTL